MYPQSTTATITTTKVLNAIDVIGQEKGIAVSAYIRVALCPVGNINAATFKKYASMIQRCEEVPLSQLTRFSDDNKKSPFQNMDWVRNRMKFYFVDGTNISPQFSEINQYRKVHAVIGIMSCLSETKVSDGYEKYQFIKKQFGYTAQIGRCFAVEPLDDQPDVEMKELIMIPNQDLEHLEFYIVSQFNDLAAELLRNFETFASDPKHLMSLASMNDFSTLNTVNYTTNTTNTVNNTTTTRQQQATLSQQQQQQQLLLMSSSITSEYNLKKRNEVKMFKIFADYALLSGDFVDAIIKYQQAIEVAKTMTEDVVLYASCVEGIAASLYWKYVAAMGHSSLSNNNIIDEIAQKYEEAINLYQKSQVKELHVEALLRFAHFNANCTIATRKMNALDCATRAVEFSSSLTTQERILVRGYAARICYSLGFKRKFGFFLRETAMLHNQLHNQSVSMRLASLCLDSFHLPIHLQDSEWVCSTNTNTNNTNTNNNNTNTNNNKKKSLTTTTTTVVVGWQRLQLKLLRDLISFAASMSPVDYLTEAQLTLYLLCAYHDVLKWAEQAELFERFCELSRRMGQNAANICLLPLPVLGQVDPLKMPAHLEPIAHKEQDEGKNSIFIFSPFDRDDSTVMKINWVQNELAKVNLILHNPFLFEISLKRISLKMRLEHGECEVYETSATIKPGREHLAEITVKPLGCGKLTIEAVEIDFEKCNLKYPLTVPVPLLKKGEKDIEITVLEKIPLLNIHVPSAVISMFDGESLSTTLAFQNISSNPIHTIVTSIENRTSGSSSSSSGSSSGSGSGGGSSSGGSSSGSRSILRIDNECLQRTLPLNPNGQTINADLYIDGRWSGTSTNSSNGGGENIINQSISTVNIKVKYFGVSRAWYREITIPIQLNIMRGLVLLGCLAVNEQYGREIVAEIQNQSIYPFVLLSNNEEEQRLRIEREVDIVQRHNNVDWKQFVQGIPMAPGSKKMIVVGSHILHDKANSITGTGTGTTSSSEPFRIPYSADIQEYKEEIAQRLRWKSFMNTYGIVGCELPEHHQQQQQQQQPLMYTRRREEEVIVSKPLKEEVDMRLQIELGNSMDPCVYGSTNSSILQLDNFDVDVIRTTPPTFKTPVGTSQLLKWTLFKEPKNKKAFRVTIQVYQDAPNGSKVQVSPEQLAYSGQLSTSVNNFELESSGTTTTTTVGNGSTTTDENKKKEDDTTSIGGGGGNGGNGGESTQYNHEVQLFFLEKGCYSLSVECVDDITEELLAKPLQIFVDAE